ncbi:hypothetical protein [Lederbergia citri]|uniref:Flagellar hook-length control protein-like C-terminal domain-containing protein n=1 Tax=Lederbergia citri TaxID=2833580 RepID=A0A942YEZ3_9BACI|nr:hypothetical protein [Lederbergia citri]MBS4193967.1 hypothetical protein [Lederbergia citri]
MVMQAVMKSLLQNQEAKPTSSIQFRPGQIFYGVIQKLFPNQHAEIQVGAKKLIAKLEVPLTNGKGYWLQVTSNDGAPKLKLLNTSTPFSQSESSSTSSLLQQLGLHSHKMNHSLIQFLRNENIPLTKEEIVRAAQLLPLANNVEDGLQTIKMMSDRKWPLNEGIFKSFLALGKDESTAQLLHSLRASLLLEKNPTNSGKEIVNLLQSWDSEDAEMVQYGREKTLNQLKQSLHRTGMFYENSLLDREINRESLTESIKPLLVRFLQETSQSNLSESKNIVEQLLFRMNGYQLVSSDNGPIHHLLFEFPIKLGQFQSEILMQWSGKRTSEGKINSDYCRVIFYLDLEHLKETVVDMNVQNRIVTVNIVNSSNILQKLSESLLPDVANGLKEIGYHLSSVNFKLPENLKQQDNKKSRYYSQQSYSGVDFRI